MAETRTTEPTVADRQRDRVARGIGKRTAARFGSDRPSPPRRRRPALAALAVLLIVGGAALAGLLALRLDSRTPVLVMAQDVPAGAQITEDVLTTANVAGDDLHVVPKSQINEVLGTYTTTPLTQGQLLETSGLTQAEPISDDRAQVGISLEAGHAPGSLRSGDLVRLVRIGDGNSAPTAIATGLILRTDVDTSGGSLGRSSQESSTATVLVPTIAADATVDASANERLGIALVQRDVSLDDARLVVLGSTR